jgi:hypothetical protein
LLGTFHARFREGKLHELGNLVISEQGKALTELVVVSALLVQERSDEGKLAVRFLLMWR